MEENEISFVDWVLRNPGRTSEELAPIAIVEFPAETTDIVAREIDHLRRHADRAEEQRHVRTLLSLVTPPAPQMSLGIADGRVVDGEGPSIVPTAATVASYRKWLHREFALYDGTRVSWGEATIEQHRLRIAKLETSRNGLSETIARHKVVVAELERSGARCLNELVQQAA